MSRIVVESNCPECGRPTELRNHYTTHGKPCPGPGGSRTVLSEPSEEMVERAEAAWDADVRRMFATDEYDDPGWFALRMRRVLTAALFSSDVGEREETR